MDQSENCQGMSAQLIVPKSSALPLEPQGGSCFIFGVDNRPSFSLSTPLESLTGIPAFPYSFLCLLLRLI